MNAQYAHVSPISLPISDMKTLIRYDLDIRYLEPWCYHTSNEACASLLHSSSRHDISLYPNILCHIAKLA